MKQIILLSFLFAMPLALFSNELEEQLSNAIDTSDLSTVKMLSGDYPYLIDRAHFSPISPITKNTKNTNYSSFAAQAKSLYNKKFQTQEAKDVWDYLKAWEAQWEFYKTFTLEGYKCISPDSRVKECNSYFICEHQDMVDHFFKAIEEADFKTLKTFRHTHPLLICNTHNKNKMRPIEYARVVDMHAQEVQNKFALLYNKKDDLLCRKIQCYGRAYGMMTSLLEEWSKEVSEVYFTSPQVNSDPMEVESFAEVHTITLRPS